MTKPQRLLSAMKRPFLVGAALLLLGGQAVGAKLTGEVVALSDGDTVTVLDIEKTQHKVRLAGIDAPEKRQAFGERSKQNLAAMVFRKQVTVEWQKSDRYGRIVGKVLVGGADVCLAQLRAGMAWHYKQYAREQTPGDRAAYAGAEGAAQEAHVGLWSQRDAVPPWDFRRAANALTQPASP
jgi:endonuclease YncB( thermonuclease family)